MSPREYDVVIAGGGFAGIIAAGMLADHNLSILLIDENWALGGQFLRTHPPTGRNGHPLKKLGYLSLRDLKKKKVDIVTRAQVLDITPDKEILLEEDGERLFTLKPEIVLLASGAREKFIPFKGWTLPGGHLHRRRPDTHEGIQGAARRRNIDSRIRPFHLHRGRGDIGELRPGAGDFGPKFAP